MKTSTKRTVSGTTFIEILLYIALLSIVVVFITDIILQTLSFMIESRNISYLDSDARYISARLRTDLRRAESIVEPNTTGETANSISLVLDGDNYSYALNQGALEITDPNGTYRINSDQTTVSSFSITNVSYATGSPTFNITLGLQARTVSGGVDAIDINLTINSRQ